MNVPRDRPAVEGSREHKQRPDKDSASKLGPFRAESVDGWYFFLGLDDGTVYALPDELELFEGDLRPVHTDLSSLRHLLELLRRRVLKVDREWAGGDQSARYAELARFADGIQDEFERVDPVVFSAEESRESPWVYFFGDLRDGLYGDYYSRLGRP